MCHQELKKILKIDKTATRNPRLKTLEGFDKGIAIRAVNENPQISAP